MIYFSDFGTGGGGSPVADFEHVDVLTWFGASSATTTLDLTNSGGNDVQEGDLVIIAAMNDSTANPGFNYVSTSGYTKWINDGGSGSMWAEAYYKILGSSETTVDLKSHSSTATTPFVITIYRGINPTSPYVGKAAASVGAGGLPNPPAYDPGEVPVLRIIVGFLDDDNDTMGLPSGYSNAAARGSGDGSVAIGGKVDEVGGSEDPGAFTGSGFDENLGYHGAFRIAGAIP